MMRILVLSSWLVLVSFAYSKEEVEVPARQPLDQVLFSKDVFNRSLVEIKKIYDKAGKKTLIEVKTPKEIKTVIQEGKLYRKGGSFEWLSSTKKALRSPGNDFTLLDKDVGEVVLRSRKGKLSSVSVSLFNRGDDKAISKSEYQDLISKWKAVLDEELKVRAEARNKKGVVTLTGWMWEKGNVAYLLEGSLAPKTNRAEFVRLRMASQASTRERVKTKNRLSLTGNVIRNKKGDVSIKGLPMVDQGKKGYCVVASVERIARYYGLNVDQHELAQLANTSAGRGTKGDDMDKAFKKITGKLHVKTLELMDYDGKQYLRDLKGYNREAKKAGGKVFPKNYYSAPGFWMQLDKPAFKTVKAKQPKFKAFKKHVERRIDEGIPLCWTLYLGMFPETEGSQAIGGHMRIIHGYNDSTEEILYTDSWGDGHELKRMPAIEAWCMTTGLYAMVPTN